MMRCPAQRELRELQELLRLASRNRSSWAAPADGGSCTLSCAVAHPLAIATVIAAAATILPCPRRPVHQPSLSLCACPHHPLIHCAAAFGHTIFVLRALKGSLSSYYHVAWGQVLRLRA